jgi:alpha-tubulin suppressor-like RCC1 family protein
MHEVHVVDGGMHNLPEGVMDVMLGTMGSRGQPFVPSVVRSLLGLKIVQIACGGQHAAVLTEQGAVYTYGKGAYGRLGHGDTLSLTTPKRVAALDGVFITSVALGFGFSCAVSREGALYAWGANDNGRSGFGDRADRQVPMRVKALRDHRVTSVAAGSVHMCVLTDLGHLYSCGKSEYTGHGTRHDVLEPMLLDAFDGVPIKQVSIGSGGYHTLALTQRGDVYAWGHHRVHQLGPVDDNLLLRNEDGAWYMPTPVLLSADRLFAQDTRATSSTSLSSTTSTSSLMDSHNHTEEEQEQEEVVQVVAGWGHSALLTASGRVYMAGRNVQGQLGLGPVDRFPQNERGKGC